MSRPSSLVLFLCFFATSCTEPKSREDPSLNRAFRLINEDPSAALKEFSKVKNREGERRLYGEGLAHEALSEFEAAAASYDKALRIKAGWIPARIARARVQILSGDRKGAHARLEKWIETAPDDLQALALYSITAQGQGQLGGAVKLLSRWTGLVPKAPGATIPAEFYLLRGALSQELGKKGASDRDLRMGAQSALRSHSGALALARLAASLGKTALARSLLERMARENLKTSDAREVVSLALKLQQIEVAKTAALKIPFYPESALNFLVLGRLRVATEQPNEAISALSKCLELLPHDEEMHREEVRFLLAQALLQKGLAKQALPHLLALEKTSPERLSVQLLLAKASVLLNHLDDAVVRLTKSTNTHPTSNKASFALTDALRKKGDLQAAEQQLMKVLKREPRNEGALQQLVEVLTTAKKLKELETLLRKLSLDDLENTKLLRLLVNFLLGNERQKEAIDIAKERAAAHPQSESLALLLASTHEVLGQKTELHQVLLGISRRFPKSAAAWHSLAQLEESMGQFAAAEAALVTVLELSPTNTRARSHLAAHYMREKKYDEAAKHYEKLLRLSPKDPIALNNLAIIYLEHLKRPKDAVPLAERAVAISSSPSFQDTLAWSLLVLGRPQDRERALSLSKRANKKLDHPDLQIHLAVAYFVSGQKERATELLVGHKLLPDVPGHVLARRLMGM